MKQSRWLTLGLVLAVGYACTVESQPNETNQKQPVKTDGFFVPGQANLYLDESTAQLLEEIPTKGGALSASPQMSRVLADVGATCLERIFPNAGEYETRSREMGLHRWYRVTFNPDVSLDHAEELFRQVKGILTFERNLKVTEKALTLPFNDPYLPSQWQYYNPGNKNEWMTGADMDVLAVWKFFTTGNPAVKVAVVDSGVQLDHEDIAANADVENSYNFVTNSSSIQPAGHGTHVAGTIAAVNNNGTGVSGLAGGDAAIGQKGVRIMSLQILGDDGNGSGSGEQAIKWAADHGAVLCNNSWGYSFTDDKGNYDAERAQETHEFYLQPNEGEYRSSLKSAIDYFNRYAGIDASGKQTGPMAGGVVFFSAGNENRPWGAPAGYPGIVAVGSIGPHGYRTYYSNYGDWVDISATGGDANYGNILSTYTNNGYGSLQGTSMACPHITGVAALLVSYFGEEGFTREMLLERILGGTSPLVSLSGQPIGTLSDAYAAFTLGQDMTPAIPSDFKGECHSNIINVSWSVTGSEDGIPAAGYVLFYGTSKEAVEDASMQKSQASVDKKIFITTTSNVGENLIQTLSDLRFETPYYLKLIGYDVQGHSSVTPILTLITKSNQPPQILPIQDVSDISLKNFETIDIDFTVTDPDGHALNVRHEPGAPSEKWVGTQSGYRLSLSGVGLSPGNYTSLITAKDIYGATSEFKLTYRILPNQPPVVVTEIPNLIFEGIGQPKDFELNPYFSDPDGETLSYSITNSEQTIVHANVNNYRLYVTPLSFGMSRILVSASDAKGDAVTQEFRVLVRNGSTPLEVYPNPVKDRLYIRTAQAGDVALKLVSTLGAVVYEGSLQSSPFEPASIDCSGYPSGVYTLVAEAGGESYKKTVVKQ